MYETCACVIHTILLSYMCINIVSHFTLTFGGVHVLREVLINYLVAMGFFPAGVQDETLKEESQRLAS